MSPSFGLKLQCIRFGSPLLRPKDSPKCMCTASLHQPCSDLITLNFEVSFWAKIAVLGCGTRCLLIPDFTFEIASRPSQMFLQLLDFYSVRRVILQRWISSSRIARALSLCLFTNELAVDFVLAMS
jgi:hypothetical protein